MAKSKNTHLQPIRRISLRPGDIVAIPLGNRNYGYARIYRDASIAVYDYVTNGIASVESVVGNPVAFHVGYFRPRGAIFDWLRIGRVAMSSKEGPWPPPCFIEDILKPGTFRIYYRGRLRTATPSEVVGLEAQVMEPPKTIRERIKREIAGHHL